MFGHQDEPQKPVNDDNSSHDNNAFGASTVTPTNDANATSDAPVSTPSMPLPTPDAAPAVSPDALLDIKQQALQQLTPLVGHLEQTPEEKFRTTMMMIQASDNQDLLKTAYEAAQAISDEKAKAQALLDIVNEINYFTQHGNK